jgi:hypothetical protein
MCPACLGDAISIVQENAELFTVWEECPNCDGTGCCPTCEDYADLIPDKNEGKSK